MFSAYRSFVLHTLFNILLGINCLIELPKHDVNDLIKTEEIIRNCTNNLLSGLRLKRPLNDTRIKDFAAAHHYFLSITFQDSDELEEIARLTRVDRSNNTVENFTTILNELLERNVCESSANDVEDSDDTVVTYIDSFLARLNELKEIYGVNKVFSDINSNIINIFRMANKLNQSVKAKEIANTLNGSDDNFNILDSNEYWVASGRRIFRGKRTKIKYYPFMASIHILNNFQCAGSIIKSDLIVTASSCLQLAWNNRFYRENPAFLYVQVGSSFYDGGGDKIPVLEIYFHPSYHPKTLRNNVCVVRLLRHIKFRRKDRKKVQKIMIDQNPSTLPINTPGITIVGWGAKGMSNTISNPFTNILSYDILDVYPLKECQEVFSKEYVTVKNFCGGFFSKGAGACNRDVGAPGIVDGILMGVVSFGSPVCGTPDVPTVFTKLGFYYDWIENIMHMDVPRSKMLTTLQLEKDPYAPYMTTPYTTTTFKIEPVAANASPLPALEVDEEKALRTLDNKLFQEFIATMFDGNDDQKYQFLIEYAKNKLNKDISRQKGFKLERQKIVKTTTETILVNDKEPNAAFDPVTVGYESDDYISRTVPVPFENYELITYVDDLAAKLASKHREYAITNFVSTKKYTRNIARNEINNLSQKEKKIKFSSSTNSPEEILLELATESSDDSNASDELRSEDTDKTGSVKYKLNDSSIDISDIPGEQAIAELLDEIDLHQIFKGVSGETKKTPASNAKAHDNSLHVTARVPLGNQDKNNLRGDEKSEKQEEDSVLTLLYLSDNEKKNHFISDSENDMQLNSGKKYGKLSIARDLDYKDNIYNIVPKSKLYKIIAEVIEAATNNKIKNTY